MPPPRRDTARGGKLPAVLRIELEEFSHLFTSPAESTGLLRLRATLVDPTPRAKPCWASACSSCKSPRQPLTPRAAPAPLAAAARQVAVEIDEWVAQGVK